MLLRLADSAHAVHAFLNDMIDKLTLLLHLDCHRLCT